ncbi:MAG: hypothetical protein NW237_06095 [Cyanobacteriota bacterium]|nr:hypothetical protein [Cyanobacteriota bacterium]
MDTLETLLNAASKNLGSWSRKTWVQAGDNFSSIKGLVTDNANLWLSKARVVASDSASVAWDALRSRFRS